MTFLCNHKTIIHCKCGQNYLCYTCGKGAAPTQCHCDGEKFYFHSKSKKVKKELEK